MKLVLFNDYRLGVLQNGNVVDVMASLDGLHFHKPQEMVEGVILGWDQVKPKIEQEIQGKEGVPISDVTLRAPIPRPPLRPLPPSLQQKRLVSYHQYQLRYSTTNLN